MAFIDTIDAPELDTEVRAMYDRQQAHYGYVPNYARAFCHRPHVMALWAAAPERHPPRDGQATVRARDLCRRARIAQHAVLDRPWQGAVAVHPGGRRACDRPRRGPCVIVSGGVALIAFARTVAVDATAVTAADVRGLKQHGFSDGEIFDIAATSAARAFFTKLLDALGVETDAAVQELEPGFRDALAVGRPLDFDSSQYTTEPPGLQRRHG
jgi:hypothetical protein